MFRPFVGLGRRRFLSALPALAILLVGALGSALGNYGQYMLSLVVINAVVGVAMVVLVGYARVVMIASAAMLAIGAYGSALLMLHAQVSYLLTLPLCFAIGGLAGGLLAVPAVRFRGHYLAMVTLVFQFLVIIGIREWEGVTGGSLGLRFPSVTVGGHAIVTDGAWLLLIVAVSALLVGFLTVLLQGRFGLVLRAIVGSEVAAQAYGVDVRRYYIAAFALASGVLACSGTLLGPRLRILDPESFGMLQSIMALAYPIVGGMTSIWGGLLGGALLKAVSDVLRSVGQYQELVVSLLVVGVVLFQPAGLVALWPRRKRRADATPQEPSPQLAFRVPQAPVDAIRIAGLGKYYGALRAVDRVDLAVPTGVIHGVIGPNGAGKTTLFNCLSGFTSSDEGSLDILGQSVGSHPARTRIGLGVTRTFQHVAVFGSLTCLDNVLLGLGKNDVTAALLNGAAQLVARKGHAADVARAHAALAEVGLADAADKVAGQLSLGNQRRLEIARAIVSQPRVLLLDEPVSGVSRAEESQIADLLRRLNRDHGITMVLIEHNMAFVRGLCHTLSVMSAGRIIAEGEPGTVLDSPLVQRIYFGAAEAKNAA